MKKKFEFEGTVFGSNDTVKLEITPNEKPVIKDDKSRETKDIPNSGKAVS